MRRKLLQWTLAMIAAALPAIPSLAQIPDGYYDSLKGMTFPDFCRHFFTL